MERIGSCSFYAFRNSDAAATGSMESHFNICESGEMKVGILLVVPVLLTGCLYGPCIDGP